MKITGIIMAGGEGRRLGRNKALVEVGGRPVIERIIETLKPLCGEVIISANETSIYETYGLRVIPDVYKEVGAIAGLHAALGAADTEQNLVVACDMPFLNTGLLRFMIGMSPTADALVPRWESEFEPLHAVYSKTCLGPVLSLIEKGERRIIDFYDKIDLEVIGREDIRRFDPDGLSFFNINSEADLQRAQQIAGEM